MGPPPARAHTSFGALVGLSSILSHVVLYYGVDYFVNSLEAPGVRTKKGLTPLDAGDRLAYVVGYCAPMILVQWLIFELLASCRAAFTSLGGTRYPFEAVPANEEPKFTDKLVRASINANEGTFLNFATVMILSYWCPGGTASAYDVRFPVAWSFMFTIGNIVYVAGYTYHPNLRMPGFFLRGFWIQSGLLLFACLRIYGMADTPTLLWRCAYGAWWFWMFVLTLVRSYIKVQTGESSINEAFDYWPDTSQAQAAKKAFYAKKK